MKYLGVDFGLRKIGLSVSEGILASPWQVLEVKNFTDAVNKTLTIIKSGEFNKIIVGLPEGKMGQTVLGFVDKLSKAGLNIETVDETLSSKKAIEQMIAENLPVKKRRSNDAYSAAIILQNFLDNS
ncbi:Holliday junction resolvase RuvX [Candidatus Daviesbacteria bacterium]|nr:Holliday junction resolvase RuvX [Candidatus Daviesbacteria bacterium]